MEMAIEKLGGGGGSGILFDSIFYFILFRAGRAMVRLIGSARMVGLCVIDGEGWVV